ncbi:MAG: substrate-binding domain-containing protein [Deltaproteobacteria bacterium]|nr:substrate-binding domain-containing protein [Deltaproteobacteria bacterium]
MKPKSFIRISVGLLVAGALSCRPVAKPAPVILATTTSTEDTGLLDALLPLFEKQTGIKVKTVAVGSGEAIEMARRGEADVLLVHSPQAEEKLVAEGKGARRRAVMHNDFVIAGPPSDPARVAGTMKAVDGLVAIAKAKAAFVSRGDASGTHKKEKALWDAAGVRPAGEWYVEAGQGMGATLRIASEKQAYTLADRGTFAATRNLNLKVLVEGDPALLNPYHVIDVVGPKANAAGGRVLADFFVSPATQRAIGGFARAGQKLFVPDATP